MTDFAFEFACDLDNCYGGRKGKQTRVFNPVTRHVRFQPLKQGRRHLVRVDRSRAHRSQHVTWTEDDAVTAIRTTCCGICGGEFYGPNHYCSSCDWAMEAFGAIQCYSCNRAFDTCSAPCRDCPRSFKRHLRESEEEATRFIWDNVPLFAEEEAAPPPWVW
jgi:hypothetical protein